MIYIIVFSLVVISFAAIIWVDFNHNKLMIRKYMNMDLITTRPDSIPCHALKENIDPVAKGNWTADISNPDFISIQFIATAYWFLKRLPKCIWNNQLGFFQRELGGVIDKEIPLSQIIGLQFCIYRIQPLKKEKRPRKILFEHNIIYLSNEKVNRITMAVTEKPKVEIMQFLSKKYNIPVYSSITFEELEYVECGCPSGTKTQLTN